MRIWACTNRVAPIELHRVIQNLTYVPYTYHTNGNFPATYIYTYTRTHVNMLIPFILHYCISQYLMCMQVSPPPFVPHALIKVYQQE